jgi:hypothetical protein
MTERRKRAVKEYAVPALLLAASLVLHVLTQWAPSLRWLVDGPDSATLGSGIIAAFLAWLRNHDRGQVSIDSGKLASMEQAIWQIDGVSRETHRSQGLRIARAEERLDGHDGDLVEAQKTLDSHHEQILYLHDGIKQVNPQYNPPATIYRRPAS